MTHYTPNKNAKDFMEVLPPNIRNALVPLEETCLAVVNESCFSFVFCAKMKKTVLKKNPFTNVMKKHASKIFSPAGKTTRLFSDSQTVVSFLRFLSHARMHAINAISHLSHATHVINAILHAINAINAILHARNGTNAINNVIASC